MAFQLHKIKAFGMEAEEPLNKRYKQHLVLLISALTTDVDLDIGDFPNGNFWSQVGTASEVAQALLKTLREIQLKAEALDWVGGRGLIQKARVGPAAPAAGQYGYVLDPVNTFIPNITFAAADGVNIYVLTLEWQLKDNEAPVEVSSPAVFPHLGPVALDLQTARNFTILGGSQVNNVGVTVVTGDAGVAPGAVFTGFPPGVVTGVIHVNDAAALQAQADLLTAFNFGNALPGAILIPADIGGQTLAPGLYAPAAALAITTLPLILDGLGDPTAVWIFQCPSTLTVAAGIQVVLMNGANAANIFWLVGTDATLAAASGMKGNVMAASDFTMAAAATLVGRGYAHTDQVNLATNIVSP